MSDRYPEIQALYDSRCLEGQVLPEQAHESMKMYAGHALFAEKNQFPPQKNLVMNMGHMVDALPFQPQQRSTRISDEHSANPEAAPWLYYQQPPPPRGYHAQMQGYFHDRRSFPPHTPAILPFNNMTGSTPYPMYYPYYQPSPPIAQQYPSTQGQGRAQAQRSYAMSKENPLTPYNQEMPTYPFHMAQVMRDHRFSSSGSNATAGSSPEELTAHTSPEEHSATDQSNGPPRKPRQSGHALWVGNLPPTATVSDLKDHFSRGLTTDIESLKLIAKSNCAFVNYRTAAACAVAMQSFHDSRFHGTRLVCRLRRSSDPTIATIGPTTRAGFGEFPTLNNVAQDEHDTVTKIPERFFVLKSLTVQDLETSLRTKNWATQAHNEASLNTAYSSAEHVYLIFSANKSGEYFGYARMASAITSSDPVRPTLTPHTSSGSSQTQYTPPSTLSESAPQSIPSPCSITTSATEWAPSGKIIEDHARGTIFWEADLDHTTSTTAVELAPMNEADNSHPTPPPDTAIKSARSDNSIEHLQSSGSSFQLDWISTVHVPFYTTRGLRNPWNANREVKIARDGTELEPSVGRKLLALFSNPAIGRGSIPVY